MKLPFKIVWNKPEDDRHEQAQERRLRDLEKQVRDLEKASSLWRTTSTAGAWRGNTYLVSEVVEWA